MRTHRVSMQEDVWEKFEHGVYALVQTKWENCEILHNRPIYVYDITQKVYRLRNKYFETTQYSFSSKLMQKNCYTGKFDQLEVYANAVHSKSDKARPNLQLFQNSKSFSVYIS